MNKISQIEKKLLEFKRRELEILEDSGFRERAERAKEQMDSLITPQLLQQLAEIKKPPVFWGLIKSSEVWDNKKTGKR